MLKRLFRPSLALVAAFLVAGITPAAQQPPPGPDMTIDAATRSAVIDGALKALNAAYVFPEVAAKMERAIRDRQEKKEYDTVTSARAFADALTAHLQEVSRDKHLRLMYSANALPPQPPPDARPSPEEIERQQERARGQMALINFGFEKVERLAGNIGYLDLRGFLPPMLVGETAAAAMTFLANTDAVIIDMRQNGGGSPETVALVTTYLFGPQPVHLNDIYNRPSNTTRQFWTLPYVPGKRLAGKDVYVLTSSFTFSGGEEFAYNLKQLKRATIVGEVTGGGANPGGGRRLTDHFGINVPSGRAINPISKTNWEGVGVEPDVKVPAAKALATAHLLALEKRAGSVTDPRLKSEITGAVDRLRKETAGS
jgi:retinol-binding protein 3